MGALLTHFSPGYPTYYPSSYYSKPNFYDNVEDKALGYETQQGYSDNENDNANGEIACP